ncbi:MAG: M24 family metallopeptidase [Pseudobdellovibrionaceae bacterium]
MANKDQIEKVDPQFLTEGLIRARAKTIDVMHEIRSALTEGMNENDARLLTLSIFQNHGVSKHWHKPWIRFGEGTTLSFYDPISESKLNKNDIYHLDLGPVWPAEKLGLEGDMEYEGDYGDTFVFGSNDEAQKMIDALHDSFHETKKSWKEKELSGEDLYKVFKDNVESKGYIFVDKVDGHRISDFPHHKYTRDRLSKISFVPTSSLWILEAMICHPVQKIGAFYEDIMN